MRYRNISLMGYQLLLSNFEGDRHLWVDRPGRGQRDAMRYAPPAWLATGTRPGGLPPKGVAPAPWGGAHAHRSYFSQSASRRFVRVILPVWAAPDLLRPGVGGRASRCPAAFLASLGVGGIFSTLQGGTIKRTASSRRTSGSRLSADLLWDRRACAMRAPASAAAVGASQ